MITKAKEEERDYSQAMTSKSSRILFKTTSELAAERGGKGFNTSTIASPMELPTVSSKTKLKPLAAESSTAVATTTTTTRCRLKRTYFFGLLIFGIIVTALILWVMIHLNYGSTSTTSDFQPVICKTQQCQVYSNYLNSMIDTSRHPCDNLYAFVCGKSTSDFTIQTKTLDDVIIHLHRNIFRGPDPTYSHRSILLKARNLYRSCCSTATGADSTEDLKIFLGKWNLLIDNYEIEKLLQVLVNLSLIWSQDVWFSLSIQYSTRNKYIFLKISENSRYQYWLFRLGPSFYSKKNSRRIDRYLNKFSDNKDNDFVKRVENKILDSDEALRNITRRGTSGEKILSFSDLTHYDLNPDMWIEAISKALNSKWKPNRDDIIYAQNEEILNYISQILKANESIALSVQMWWYLINQLAPMASVEYPLYSDIVNVSSDTQCYTMVYLFLSPVLIFTYLHKHVSLNGLKKLVPEIVSTFTKSFEEKQVNKSSKAALVEKLSNIKVMLGYFDGTETEEKMNDFYDGFRDVNSSNIINWLNFFEDYNNFKRSFLNETFELAIYVSLHESINHVLSYMAFPDNNVVYISPYWLLHPIYDEQLPSSINYGSLGYVITQAVAETINVSNIMDREMMLHPMLNVRSSVLTYSLSVTFAAFKNVMKLRQRNILPGTELSPEELFFVATCYPVCTMENHQDHKEYENQCNIPAKNLKVFHNTFKCKSS